MISHASSFVSGGETNTPEYKPIVQDCVLWGLSVEEDANLSVSAQVFKSSRV